MDLLLKNGCFSFESITHYAPKKLCMIFVGERIEVFWGSGSLQLYMAVSKNNGTPKWMVYKGKPY